MTKKNEQIYNCIKGTGSKREREGKRQIRTNKKREENKNHIRNQNLHLRFSYRKGNVEKNTEEFDKQKW